MRIKNHANTISSYNENGNEVNFEFIHDVSYEGETYYILCSEETDGTIIVVKRNDNYEIVDDDET